MPSMSLPQDPFISRSHCNGIPKPDEKTAIHGVPQKKRHLPFLPSISLPSVSSLVKSPFTWAGGVLSTYGYARKPHEKLSVNLARRKDDLYLAMHKAESYEEWKKHASELDFLEGNGYWKQDNQDPGYNHRLIEEYVQAMEEAGEIKDLSRILDIIRSLCRNLGNTCNPALYTHSHVGTKDLIDRYTTVAVETITSLVDLCGNGRCDEDEVAYIHDQLVMAREVFGRSALCFSGGATYGMLHIGVLKTLYKANLLPRVISGASAGSIVASIFCCHREDEMPALLEKFTSNSLKVFEELDEDRNIYSISNIWTKLGRYWNHGSFLDITHLSEAVREWLGDITFLEAFNRTRRTLNVCVSSAGLYQTPTILNYITSPDVLVWSAVTVSCSVPFVFAAPDLLAKDPKTGQPVRWNEVQGGFYDGSVDGDLPMDRLAEQFNVNHFIVSQVNPHVSPFLPRDDVPPHHPTWISLLSHPLSRAAVRFLKEEAIHQITRGTEIGFLPVWVSKTASILNQKYYGDITIYPEIDFSKFPLILENPTADFMVDSCLRGEQATWPKLARIRNHCAIEVALDTAIHGVRARMASCASELDMLRLGAEYADVNRGGRLIQRRNSYGHEVEKKRALRSTSTHKSRPALRRSHTGIPSSMKLLTDFSNERPTKNQPSYFPSVDDAPVFQFTDSDNESTEVESWDSPPKNDDLFVLSDQHATFTSWTLSPSSPPITFGHPFSKDVGRPSDLTIPDHDTPQQTSPSPISPKAAHTPTGPLSPAPPLSPSSPFSLRMTPAESFTKG